MAKTVVGLFDSFDDAQQVVQELVDRGLDRNEISLVANDANGRYKDFSNQVGGTTNTEAAEGAGAGAVGGTVLGGTLGLLVGLGALAIPGIGPVLAAGPLAAAVGTTSAAVGAAALGSGIGAATGALAGGLVGAGIPDEDAQLYSEGVRRGGTLVMVRADNDLADDAVDIMNRYGAVDLDNRGTDYRNEGWTGFNADDQPYSGQYTSDYYTSRRTDTVDQYDANRATNPVTGAASLVGGTYDDSQRGTIGTTSGTGDSASENYAESSKAGTVGGGAAGAITGAAIGAAGGPVGAVIGGVAGAVTGGSAGAVGDTAGEAAEDRVTGDDDTATTAMDSSSGLRGADLGFNAERGLIDVDNTSTSTTSGYTTGDTISTSTTGTGDSAAENYAESSKAGTAGGALAGAASGAAIGAAGGPVGAVIGGVAGAVTGAGVGAAGDTAGEAAADAGTFDRDRTTGDYTTTGSTMTNTTTTGYSDVDTTNRVTGDYGTTRNVTNVEGETVLPVIEERLAVGKREVRRGGARIHTFITETPVEEQVTLRDETVRVERRTVDRPLTDAELNAFQEGTIEITETDEEAVVQKQARIVEEIVVNKEVEQRTETIRDTVRRTDVEVEQLTGETTTTGTTIVSDATSIGATSTGSTFESYDNDFRSYYQSNYANSGYTYDQYSPVFRYGYQLGGDKRYQGDWTEVEPEARRYWEERNPGTWENFKDSVRYAWDKARGRA